MAVDHAMTAVPLWDELPACESLQASSGAQGGVALLPQTVTLFDESLLFQLRETQQPAPPAACSVMLKMGGAHGGISVDAEWLDGLCERAGLVRPGQTSWMQVPAIVRSHLVACVLAPVLAHLKTVCGHDFVPEPGAAQGAPAVGMRRVVLSLASDSRPAAGVMWLDVPDAALRRLPLDHAQETLWLSIPVAAGLQAGRQMLTLAQLASLRPGDVVLLIRPLNGMYLAVAPCLLAHVREQDDAYVVCSGWFIDERREAPLDNIPTDSEAMPSVILDQLTVPLVCEVGRLVMSMADLKGLKPGSLLPMNRFADQAVDLVVNGQKIGQGELVRLDGALGVRVLRLADVNG